MDITSTLQVLLLFIKTKGGKPNMLNSRTSNKFTMEDVNAAHSIKPYLPKKRFIKFFGFLNYKLSKGWSGQKIAKLIELCVEGNGDLFMENKD